MRKAQQTASKGRNMMKKIIYIIILTLSALALVSCSSSAPRAESSPPDGSVGGTGNVNADSTGGFWSTAPYFDELVFHGAAGVRSNREDAIRLALEDAARKASIFTRVQGKFVSYSNTAVNFFDYRSETESSLFHDENYANYSENFIFDPETDVLQDHHAVFVRVRYPSAVPAAISYRLQFYHGTAKPGWIDNPPPVSGYITGIGYADRRASHADTVKVSYENAVFAIILNISSTVEGSMAAVRGSDGFGSQSTGEVKVSAEGVLQGFYVLDFWVDPASQAVWTLAIAKPDLQDTF
jgi:hypothetical protein